MNNSVYHFILYESPMRSYPDTVYPLMKNDSLVLVRKRVVGYYVSLLCSCLNCFDGANMGSVF